MKKELCRLFILSILLPICSLLNAQVKTDLTSGELYKKLEKLNTLGSVLYIAAHPDDENTRLISYLSNQKNLRTAYLSLTRGDGGQNLIGTEIGAGIGVLRTQELLAARRIDGGEQFFTRAVDFGYSKSADETFSKWDRETILSDVVWVIRNFKPDVIITRFPTSSYAGHGHHSASAILAEEAFDLAANPTKFPEQLKYVQPWQTKRMYLNASTWWNKGIIEEAKGSPDYITLDVGEFSPILGKSYAEIAAESRSQHKSQGFGAEKPKGELIEYLKYIKGDKADREKGIFDGINTTWSSIEGGNEINEILKQTLNKFDPLAPHNSVSALLEVYKKIQNINNEHWKKIKSEEVKILLAACSGIWIDAYTSTPFISPGSTINITNHLIARTPVDAEIESISIFNKEVGSKIELSKNQLISKEFDVKIPEDLGTSNPYWLHAPYKNVFQVDDQELIGLAENQPPVYFTYEVILEGTKLEFRRPVMHKVVDPVRGEVYSPLQILPALTVNFQSEAFLYTQEKEQSVSVLVNAHQKNLNGKLELSAPQNWEIEPQNYSFKFDFAGEAKVFEFKVKPGKGATSGKLEAMVTADDESYKLSLTKIDYDHIRSQIILSPANTELVYFDFKPGIQKIAYINGPGDEVAKYLRAVGYEVDEFSASEIPTINLDKYQTVVTGIRAYNTDENLKNINTQLNEFVKAGGTLVVQYNTAHDLVTDQIGPYPFNISRERVTVEESKAQFLNPDHAVFNYPNKLSSKDFDGWVQERGLYFSDSWSKEFTPLISWNDPGEKALTGALIVAPYGNGNVVYTGISFFRELPAAVPGAYRLFANILSLSTVDAH